MARRLSSPCAVLTAAIVLVPSVAGVASSHSSHDATITGDGAAEKTAPEVILLSFDSPTRITMNAPSNARGEEFALEPSDGIAPVTRLEAAPAHLSACSCTPEWRGLRVDGHPASCGYSFEAQQ